MNNALTIIAEELNIQHGLVAPGNITSGYIGNVERGRDDRSWYFFAPHPGRAGEAKDRWGGAATQEALIIRANRHNESLKRWAAGRLVALHAEGRAA